MSSNDSKQNQPPTVNVPVIAGEQKNYIQAMYLDAVPQTSPALQFVLEKYRPPEMCLEAVKPPYNWDFISLDHADDLYFLSLDRE
jgi:hypothetical protein